MLSRRALWKTFSFFDLTASSHHLLLGKPPFVPRPEPVVPGPGRRPTSFIQILLCLLLLLPDHHIALLKHRRQGAEAEAVQQRRVEAQGAGAQVARPVDRGPERPTAVRRGTLLVPVCISWPASCCDGGGAVIVVVVAAVAAVAKPKVFLRSMCRSPPR